MGKQRKEINMTTIERIKADPRVADVSDERSMGDGFWVYLKSGFAVQGDEVHCIHEDTPSDCLRELRHGVIECKCKGCRMDIAAMKRPLSLQD